MLHKLLSFNSLDDIVQFYCSNTTKQMSIVTASKLAVLGYPNHYQLTRDLASEFLHALKDNRNRFVNLWFSNLDVDEHMRVGSNDRDVLIIELNSKTEPELQYQEDGVLNLDVYPLYSPPIQHPAAESIGIIELDETDSSGGELVRPRRMSSLNAQAKLRQVIFNYN